MERKQVAFPVSEDEHARIKALASKERRTIKQLFLDMLDRFYPGCDREEKENGSK